MKKIFKDKKKKLVAIILTFAIVALSIFNVNIIQGNKGDIILPNTIEQAEALADSEVSVTVYALTYVYKNGSYVYVCVVVIVAVSGC